MTLFINYFPSQKKFKNFWETKKLKYKPKKKIINKIIKNSIIISFPMSLFQEILDKRT